MSINEFGFIGHCFDLAENHDKVWGYFYRPTPNAATWVTKESGWNCCIFWARRGRAMQFKAGVTGYDLNKLASSKLNKGYNRITQTKLFEIWPTFITEAEAKLMWDVLSGKVK